MRAALGVFPHRTDRVTGFGIDALLHADEPLERFADELSFDSLTLAYLVASPLWVERYTQNRQMPLADPGWASIRAASTVRSSKAG
jgi:hypothetical protein